MINKDIPAVISVLNRSEKTHSQDAEQLLLIDFFKSSLKRVAKNYLLAK